MKRHAGSRHSTLGFISAALFIVVAGSGCSRALPTSPLSMGSGSGRTNETATTTATVNWSLLASQWVAKGDPATVSGGRYSLQIVRGALAQGTQVTISQRDAAITDVLLGPSATVLAKQATLTIGYAGSNADPGSSFGLTPKLYHLNESTGVWELVAGTNDPVGKQFTAKISQLGRYGLSFTDPGRASW